MNLRYTANQLSVLRAIRGDDDQASLEKGFNEIFRWFGSHGLKIGQQGLSRTLTALQKSGDIRKYSNKDFKPRYSLTEIGSNHLEKYYWPIVDAIGSIDREKAIYFVYGHHGVDYHLISSGDSSLSTSHLSFYLLPLSLELHRMVLSNMAVKLVSREFDELIGLADKEKSVLESDIVLALHYRLNSLDEIAFAFNKLWNHVESGLETMYDIVSNLLGKKEPQLKRDLFATLSSMLASVYFWNETQTHDKNIRKMVKTLDKKLGEIFLNRMNLLAGLDEELVDIFIENLETGNDPLSDKRINARLLIKQSTIENHKRYLIQDYLNAAAIKKRDFDFSYKVENYIKGTQGLLIKTMRYQVENPDI